MQMPKVAPAQQRRSRTQLVGRETAVIEAARMVATLEAVPVLDDSFGLAGEVGQQAELGFQCGQKTQGAENLVSQSVIGMPAALAVEVEAEVEFHEGTLR